MAQKTIPVLKEKFSDGKEPTGADFGDVFDSYLHKSEKIPQTQIFGLQETIESATQGLIYRPPVATSAALYTTYPNAKTGWAAIVEATGTIWQCEVQPDGTKVWNDTGFPNGITSHILKRLEFLYVDVPAITTLTQYFEIKQGNLIEEVSDERGIIPYVSTDSSDDNVRRIILIATGTTYDKITHNILPESIPKIDNFFIRKNGYYAKSNGAFTENSQYIATDILPLNRTSNLEIWGFEGGTSVSLCTFFDVDFKFLGNYISGSLSDVRAILTPSDYPEGAVYFACSGRPNRNPYILHDINYQAVTLDMNLRYKKKFDDVNDKINKIDTGDIDFQKILNAATYDAKIKFREEQLRNEYQKKTLDGYIPKWYGVEFKEESNPDNVIGINSAGDNNLHTILPVQSKMRRCITNKNNVVLYYLHDDNSELKAEGTPADLSGNDGNVMVEIPEFFFKIEEEIIGGIRTIRIKISEDAIPDFKFSQKRYTSAYEATIDRNDNKFASICTTIFSRSEQSVMTESNNYIVGSGLNRGLNKTAERNGFTQNVSKYRGGTNDGSLDNENNPASVNYSRNQLGIPVANINREDCRNFSREHQFSYLL